MVSEFFFSSIIQQLKASKATWLDDFSPRLLKVSVEVTAKPLTHVTRVSLSQGVVHSDWKYAGVDAGVVWVVRLSPQSETNGNISP